MRTASGEIYACARQLFTSRKNQERALAQKNFARRWKNIFSLMYG
jgi:hypothetical protein